MTRSLLLVALVALIGAAGLSHPGPAAAHPLGNFTVNRYSRIELYSDDVRIRYVLDMAEIPTFQEVPRIDTNGDGELAPSENNAYVAQKALEIAGKLRMSVNGAPAALEVRSTDISYPKGQAGLRTMRLAFILDAPVRVSPASLEYRDDNYQDRVGWKEIVVRAAEGVNLSASTVPREDVSGELTSYPADLLSNPLDVSSALVSYDPRRGIAAPALEAKSGSASVENAPLRPGAGFASLVDSEEMTVPIILLSLLLALGFGAIHALEPGHGKSFVAAYFVGVKGTVRQALGLGLIVAVTHTIGVVAIGLVVLFGSQYVVPERLYPWLSLASALMVLGLGVRLIAARAGGWRAVRRFASLFRPGQEHHHGDHDHAHEHSHGPSPDAPPWRSLVALGLADGLTPSPSALVVLLAAVSLDRVGLGLLLIVAFSAGLAAVLTLVSLALLYARRFVEWLNADRRGSKGSSASTGGPSNLRWFGTDGTVRILRVAPLGGAAALVGIGLLLTVRALTAPGLPVF